MNETLPRVSNCDDTIDMDMLTRSDIRNWEIKSLCYFRQLNKKLTLFNEGNAWQPNDKTCGSRIPDQIERLLMELAWKKRRTKETPSDRDENQQHEQTQPAYDAKHKNIKMISIECSSNKCKSSYQTNTHSTVTFSVKLIRSYQHFLSSQADPARENWIWSYLYFS